jgi:exonuclease III
MRFGTWNVWSLYRSGSLKTVARELRKYKLDLVGVQEVRWDKGGTERAKDYTPCFKKSFTTSKECIDLFIGHTQCFEVSECSKTHQVLPQLVMVRCVFRW